MSEKTLWWIAGGVALATIAYLVLSGKSLAAPAPAATTNQDSGGENFGVQDPNAPW